MTAPAGVAPNPAVATLEPTVVRPRSLYWSVRRELWQNRSILFGPLAAASILIASIVLATIARPARFSDLLALAAGPRHEAIVRPYTFTAAMVALGGLIVGVFYCLDALQGERRDRSILFWKSLPVSDVTTILSKASIPLAVLPLVVFAVTLLLHGTMLLVSTLAVVATGGDAASLWRELPLLELPIVVLYGIAAIAVQQAPIYAWLLMVSAAAPRRTTLWAFLPPFGIVAAERLVFGHSRFMDLLRDLVVGAFARSFALDSDGSAPLPLIDRVVQLDPAALFSRPAVGIGLGVTVLFLAIAIRLRGNREPL